MRKRIPQCAGFSAAAACWAFDGKITAVTVIPTTKILHEGLFLGKILYGKDRLTTPAYSQSVSTPRAPKAACASELKTLELWSTKLRDIGRTRAVWRFGQRPAALITETFLPRYWKAGLLSNNIRIRTRACAWRSAVVSFMKLISDRRAHRVQHGRGLPHALLRLTAHKLQNESVRHIDITHNADKVLLLHRRRRTALRTPQFRMRIRCRFQCATTCKMGINIGNACEDGYDKSDLGKSVDKTTASHV